VLHRERRSVWIVAAAACLLVVIGALYPVINADLLDLIGNRVLSILAILATALFVAHARDIQERLEEQTRRARAAETIKSEVLADLGSEMGAPIRGLLSVVSLMMADCRPDQRQSLGHVRSGASRLISALDNLVDLTQLDQRTLSRGTVPLRPVIKQATDNAQFSAAERQINVVVPMIPAESAVMGDQWGVQRVLDNLLLHAIRATPPGGEVSIRIANHGAMMTISICDPGAGPPVHIGSSAEVMAFVGGSISTGLTLCQRLAEAMRGDLVAADQANGEFALQLSLPAA
jgi:signal transduction histidine kinase